MVLSPRFRVVEAVDSALYFDPPVATSMKVGDSFTTHLKLDTSVNLFGFDAVLVFDRAQLRVSISPTAVFPNSRVVDSGSGIRYLGANLSGAVSARSGIDLGTVQITALLPGSNSIQFDVSSKVTDEGGNDVVTSSRLFSYSIAANGVGGGGGSSSNPGPGGTTPRPTPTPGVRQSLENCNVDGKAGLTTDFGCIPTDPIGFAAKFYGIGLGFIGGVALLFIMYGGYLTMMSRGNPAQLSNGKSYIFYAILGLLLAIFGYVFIQIVVVNVLHVPGFS